MDQDTPACEVNRYEVIALLEIDRSHPGPWAPEADRVHQRRNTLVAGRVLEMYQGPGDFKTVQTFDANVVQREPVSGRIADNYGPWSLKNLTTGQQLLVFADRPSATSTFNHTLERGARFVINLPDPTYYPHALEDVRRATDLKRRHDFPAILEDEPFQKDIFQHRTKSGPIMARFLMDALASRDSKNLRALIYRLIEASDAPESFRAELLRHVLEEMMMKENVPIDDRARLARAMLLILKEPEETAGALHEGIIQGNLQEVVFNGTPKPLLPASQSFPDAKEREQLAVVLAKHKFGKKAKQRLEGWLRGP